MRAQSILPVMIAATVSVSAWLSGCGPDDNTTTSTGAPTSSGVGGNGAGGMTGSGGIDNPAPANDKCPGELIALKVGDSMMVSGSTEFATDDLSSTCGDADAAADSPDVVYAITLDADGTFKAKVTAGSGSSLNPALYLRSVCDSDSDTVKCVDFGTSKVEFLAGEVKAGPYYLIVDGGEKTSGAFDLSLSLSAPACGDHVLNTGESCDPPGPGCDAACQFMPPLGTLDKCPAVGGTFAVPEMGLTITEQHTTGFTDNYAPKNCTTPGSGGPDRVYQLVPDLEGSMTVKIGYDVDGTTPVCDLDPENTGCFDRVLYARSTCADDTTEIACANDGIYKPEGITFPVLKDTQYYVFVDGASAAAFGTYTLFVSIQP